LSNSNDSARRLYSATSDRVDEMSEESRAELARNLAGHKAAVPDRGLGGSKSPIAVPYVGSGRIGAAEEEEVAAEVARLSADLHRTERRMHQIERSMTSSRYQMGEGGAPSARYTRLERRARRLERQLRSLR
jgi:hypothetical protein